MDLRRDQVGILAAIIAVVAIAAGVIGFLFAKRTETSIDVAPIPARPVAETAPEAPASIAATPPASGNVLLTLQSIRDMKGEDPDTFNHGPCIYVHGEPSDVDTWATLDARTRSSLETLLQDMPLTKLDYSKNPNNVSDSVMIGPICTCAQYSDIMAKVSASKLSFPWRLAHGRGTDNDLEKCIDFSQFD